MAKCSIRDGKHPLKTRREGRSAAYPHRLTKMICQLYNSTNRSAYRLASYG